MVSVVFAGKEKGECTKQWKAGKRDDARRLHDRPGKLSGAKQADQGYRDQVEAFRHDPQRRPGKNQQGCRDEDETGSNEDAQPEILDPLTA